MASLSHYARSPAPFVGELHGSGTSVANPGFNSTFGICQTMSFKRKGPGVLASGAIGAIVGVAIVGSVIALLAIPASAQTGSITTSATFITTQWSK